MIQQVIKFWGYSALVLMVPVNIYLGIFLITATFEAKDTQYQYETSIKNVAKDYAKELSSSMKSNSNYQEYIDQLQEMQTAMADTQNTIVGFTTQSVMDSNELLQVVDQIQLVNYQNQHLYDEIMKLQDNRR